MGHEKGGNLMHTAEAMTNLPEFSRLSKTLNEESHGVNQLLQDVERKLVAMNLGVEAWTTIEERRYMEGCDEPSSRWSADLQMGFGEWNGEGKLLLKTVHYEETVDDDNGLPYWELSSEEDARPLLQASRPIRLRAMGKLEQLFHALSVEAKKVLAGSEEGKKAYKDLSLN